MDQGKRAIQAADLQATTSRAPAARPYRLMTRAPGTARWHARTLVASPSDIHRLVAAQVARIASRLGISAHAIDYTLTEL